MVAPRAPQFPQFLAPAVGIAPPQTMIWFVAGRVDLNDAGGETVLALYDRGLPQVYGYLVRRCGDPALAEDLTAETFLAAVDASQRDRPPSLTVAWLVGVARNKLVDHWRYQEREGRKL